MSERWVLQKYYDMIPPEVSHILASIFELGDKGRGYAPDSWVDLGVMHHLGKCVGHIGKFLVGSTDEPHLNCAMWRLCIAATIFHRRGYAE
jgi:hypothetical protein